jgi:hypothetical protein
MSPETDNPRSFPPDDGEGSPIGQLSALEQDTSSNFVMSVRKRIYRRTAASQFAAFSWNAPIMILMEFWGILADLFMGLGGVTEKEKP